MKTHSFKRRPGFTLVEVLTVIVIIMILAGLVVGGMALAKEKQNRDKAKVQIHLLANALEQYKADFGKYPENDAAPGTLATEKLYEALYYNGANEPDKFKIYLAELNPLANKQGWIEYKGSKTVNTVPQPGEVKIIDPWKKEYLYRTGAAAANPDFDLWSMGKDGKTDADDPKAKDSLDDIRN